MYAYTLLGASLANNMISVKNNIAAGALLQLDFSFVMRSGRAEKMFSPEDLEVLTQLTDQPLTPAKKAHNVYPPLRRVA